MRCWNIEHLLLIFYKLSMAKFQRKCCLWRIRTHLQVNALWYLRVWSQRARVLKLGQVRVFSTHFEKNKGQKVKLKGHQYSFLAALRVFIRVASTHFWPQQGFLKGHPVLVCSLSSVQKRLICRKILLSGMSLDFEDNRNMYTTNIQ